MWSERSFWVWWRTEWKIRYCSYSAIVITTSDLGVEVESHARISTQIFRSSPIHLLAQQTVTKSSENKGDLGDAFHLTSVSRFVEGSWNLLPYLISISFASPGCCLPKYRLVVSDRLDSFLAARVNAMNARWKFAYQFSQNNGICKITLGT